MIRLRVGAGPGLAAVPLAFVSITLILVAPSPCTAAVSQTTYPVHTVPSPPEGFSGTGHGGAGALTGEVRVSWNPVTTYEAPLGSDPATPAVHDLAGYRLYRSTDPAFVPSASNLIASELWDVPPGNVMPLGPGASDYRDFRIVNCRPYYYHLRAVDAAPGGKLSQTWPASYHAMAATATPPQQPNVVIANRTSPTSAVISWNPITTDTTRPAPMAITIDTYRIWRATLQYGQDPETAAYSLIDTVVTSSGSPTFVDTTAPGEKGGYHAWYKVSALDDCPNESARSTAAILNCTFSGSISLTATDSPPGPPLDLAPKTQTVTATGRDSFVSARLVINKSGGTADFDETIVASGHSWVFTWTPGQGRGTYVATATVTNATGCRSTGTQVWQVFTLR